MAGPAQSAWLLPLALLAASCAGGGRPERATGGGPYGEAELASARGDWDRAAVLWQVCLEAEGAADPRPYQEASQALLQAGDEAGAHALLSHGIERHPECVELLLLRARSSSALGFRRAAEIDYEAAIAMAPNDARLWEELGAVRLELDLPSASEQALLRCLEFGQATPRRMELLALAREAMGEPQRAAQAWERAIALARAQTGSGGRPPQTWLLAPARLLERAGLREVEADAAARALTLTEEALRRDPQYADASYLRGRLLEERGELAAAGAAYARAVEVDGFHLDALTGLARVLAAEGEMERANDIVQRALLLEQDEGRKRALRELVAVSAR